MAKKRQRWIILPIKEEDHRLLISGLGWMEQEGAASPRSKALQKRLIKRHCRIMGHTPNDPVSGIAHDGKPFRFILCDVCGKEL